MIFFISQLLFAHQEKFEAKFDHTSIRIREIDLFSSVNRRDIQKEIKQIEAKIEYFLNEYSETMERITIEDFYFIDCHDILYLISDLLKFPKLTHVKIKGTNLRSQVPPSLLSNNQLKEIYLQDNHLYGVLPQKIILNDLPCVGSSRLNLRENYFTGDQPKEIMAKGKVYKVYSDISYIFFDNFFIKNESSNTGKILIKNRNINLPMLLSAWAWYLEKTSIKIEEIGMFNVRLQIFNEDTDDVDNFFQELNELIIQYPDNGLKKLTLINSNATISASSLPDYEQLYSQLTLLCFGSGITFKNDDDLEKYPNLKIIMPQWISSYDF